MDTLAQNYERYINEIQFLKKQINGEKNAHQNTLKQLQSTYQIVDQIKEVLRAEQTASLRLKGELADRNAKIATMSGQYEGQIEEIKEVIAAKDEELRRMSSVLIVSDYDMVRLKVINELELGHREEVERLNVEISKRVGEIAQLKSKCGLLSSKCEHLSEELKKQGQLHAQEKEQINRKYTREISGLYQAVQKERSEAHKWSKKYQMLQVKNKRQGETFKEEVGKLTRQLEVQNKNMMYSSNGKINRMKIQKLEEQYMKVKEELQSQKETNKKLEDQVSRLKKQIKILKKQEGEIISEKDRASDRVQQLKVQLQSKEKEVQAMRRQYQYRSQNVDSSNKTDRQKIGKIQQQNRRLSLKIQSQQEQLKNLRQKSKQNNSNLVRKELAQKTQEIQKLLQELNGYRKKERAKSVYQKQDSSAIKRKLGEANNKIVDLLKQKIQLSKQIRIYQHALTC